MKTRNLILGLALSLVILSCSKDDNSSNPEMSSAKKTATTNNKIDDVSNDISDITDNQIALMGAMPGKSGDTPEQFLANCVASAPTHPDDNTWTNTLTFSNCQLPNGNTLDGTITISVLKNTDNLSITYTFTNFHHNGTLVEGTRTVVKSIKNTDTLQSLHPVDNISMDMTFTFSDNSVYHTVGTKTREMIEGFLTRYIWHDDVFSITGNWTTTSLADGGTRTSTITTPLIRKMSCDNIHNIIVSGVIQIVKQNDKTVTVDYGNGTCDKTATVTVDGKTETITIGKK